MENSELSEYPDSQDSINYWKWQNLQELSEFIMIDQLGSYSVEQLELIQVLKESSLPI